MKIIQEHCTGMIRGDVYGFIDESGVCLMLHDVVPAARILYGVTRAAFVLTTLRLQWGDSDALRKALLAVDISLDSEPASMCVSFAEFAEFVFAFGGKSVKPNRDNMCMRQPETLSVFRFE